MSVTIGVPECDFIAVRFKDKRKGFWWHCRSCKLLKTSKTQPECPCKPIVVGEQSGESGER